MLCNPHMRCDLAFSDQNRKCSRRFLIPLFSFRTCQCQHELTSTIFFFSVFFLQKFFTGIFQDNRYLLVHDLLACDVGIYR
ncbi:hypothetical protein K445DRAFT_205477 [Daldinia sp. EC12]|nr:hypothetical protein K445DRAFT_205477 [Daldinia sp. EC12]